MNLTKAKLQELGWINCRDKLLPNNLDIAPPLPEFRLPGSGWKAAISQKCAEVLEARTWHLLVNTASLSIMTPSHFTPNDVHVVNQAYMTNTFVSEQWWVTTNDVSKQFCLNKEQDWAFCIVTNHACCLDVDQLRMYIGGMAGTGKSQVLKALVKFFHLRNESHVLVVVMPTGSVAAILGGSTYHSMFEINGDRAQTSNI